MTKQKIAAANHAALGRIEMLVNDLREALRAARRDMEAEALRALRQEETGDAMRASRRAEAIEALETRADAILFWKEESGNGSRANQPTPK